MAFKNVYIDKLQVANRRKIKDYFLPKYATQTQAYTTSTWFLYFKSETEETRTNARLLH